MKILIPNELYRARFVVCFCILQFTYLLVSALVGMRNGWINFGVNVPLLLLVFGAYPLWANRQRLGYYRFLFKQRHTFQWLYNTKDIGVMYLLNAHGNFHIVSLDRETRILKIWYITKEEEWIIPLAAYTCFLSSVLFLLLPVNRLLDKNFKEDAAEQLLERTTNLDLLDRQQLRVDRLRKLKLLLD